MSGIVTRAEIANLLGADFPSREPLTFAQVWEDMKISRVFRFVRDFIPDDELEAAPACSV